MRFLSFFITGLILVACSADPKTLFTQLDPDDTGVDFRNQIFEDDKVNILELEYVYNGGGVSVADFNNDGLSDLFFTANMLPNKLYLNRGDFEFEDVSGTAGIEGFFKWKSGSAVVDINGDGWQDIYVCATISTDSTLRRNMLFVNQGFDSEGNLKFKDMAREYHLDYSGYSSNAGFFDADQDGDLDLYILVNNKQPGVPSTYRAKINDGSSTNTDKLFRNNGDGTFEDVSIESGIVCKGYSLGLAFLDVNKDGLTDVYVGNDYITNDLLYVNQGNGKFKNEIDNYIKHQSKFSMGNDVADINNDGYPDIITVDMLPETNFRKKTVLFGPGYISYINDAKYGYTHQYVRNMLQLNNGDGTFSEIGQLAGVHQTEWSWSPLFADFDNDGFRDLIVTNGFPRDVTDRDFINYRMKVNNLTSKRDMLDQVPSIKIPNNAFKNNGDLTFKEVTKEWGFNIPTFSSGAAMADLDNDGDLDYVVNNINDFASIFRNNLNSGKRKTNHYLRVKLNGDAQNKSALGTKLTLYYGQGKKQYVEHAIYRGYISTVEDFVHFGLGSESRIDSLVLVWPDETKSVVNDVPVDQILVLSKNQLNGSKFVEILPPQHSVVSSAVDQLGLDFVHDEKDKIDYNIQRTLPRKLSQSGPAIAVGDINGDDRDDFVLGGAAGFSTYKFIQSNGKFIKQPVQLNGKPSEDIGVLLFDCDNDSDLDLYCVSGSYEFEPGSANYSDRLYLNDGLGNFSKQSDLPKSKSSGSCVRAADFDRDGDLDLFVGGRTQPGRYPLADTSSLLLNDKGKFLNVTKQWAPELELTGMVVDAIWSDFDADGLIDLIVVGEFMPVTFYRNTGSTLKKINQSGIENFSGWFNSIVGADFDNDGDIDYLVGNLGYNNFYRVTQNQPLTVCAKDFDGNGSIDPILSCYAKSKNGELLSYPIHFWDELNAQSPKFRQRYNYFREFAEITTDNFFSLDELKNAVVLSANYMATSIILNQGHGKFIMKALPNEVQVAPINGIAILDIDLDGNLDASLVGNDFGNEPTYGQYDAMNGLILKGDGTGNFSIVKTKYSGFYVPGDAKALANINVKDNSILLATQNRGLLLAFSLNKQNGKWFKPKANDVGGIVNFRDGKKQRMEFYHGSGYLTQSTKSIQLSESVQFIEVFDQKGSKRIEKLP